MLEKEKDTMINYILSARPLIHVETCEYGRAIDNLITPCIEHLNSKVVPELGHAPVLQLHGYSTFIWRPYRGLNTINLSTRDESKIAEGIALHKGLSYFMEKIERPAILIVENGLSCWNPSLYEGYNSMADVLDTLVREIYTRAPYEYKHIIFIDSMPLHPSIKEYFSHISLPLPEEKEISEIVSKYIKDLRLKNKKEELPVLTNACLGMTATEIENALLISVNKSRIDRDILFREKAENAKKTNLLEYVEVKETVDDIGGLENFKGWAEKIAKVYKEPHKAQKYNLPIPNGTILVGISGTGKTLAGKVISNLFGVPLFKFNIDRLYNSLVGESEKNARETFKIIEGLNRCVILCDEIEKGFAGYNTDNTGITSRILSNFLTFMQDKKCMAFFVLTANSVENLPPELLRKGRFDELWYVGLPSKQDIIEILKIHLRKVGRNPDNFNIEKIADCMTYFTGAEVASTVKEAMYNAFYEDREVNTEDMIKVAKEVIPLYKLKAEEISEMEKWAKYRARFASINKTEKNISHPAWLK